MHLRHFWVLTFLLAMVASAAAPSDTPEPAAPTDEMVPKSEYDQLMTSYKAAMDAAFQMAKKNARTKAASAPVPGREGWVDEISEESRVSLAEKYRASTEDRLQFEMDIRRQNLKSFRWQKFASNVLMLLVVGVAGLGVYLSFKEIRQGMRLKEMTMRHRQEMAMRALQARIDGKTDDETLAPIDPENPPETVRSMFKASASGLEISSTVSGIIILVVSLAFTFVFVKDVYKLDTIRLYGSDQQIQVMGQ